MAADIEKLKILRSKIEKNLFYYGSYFVELEASNQWNTGKVVTCKTAACCAGWGAIIFKLKDDPNLTVSEIVAGHIGLTSNQMDFLFYDYASHANYDDAIRRLDWLIARKNVSKYPWSKESWYATRKEKV